MHIYERVDTGALVGFQFWRIAAMDLPGCRALIGGKLRVDPEFRQNHYRLDPTTGLFFVGIRVTEATLAQYPASYYQRPEARAYARINPGWRDNGCNVGFWFRFTPANLATLIRTIMRKH